MTEITKQTVIVVHGTWAKYVRSKRGWYEHAEFGTWHDPVDREPSDVPFTARLDDALQERGSPARCWAHCGIDHPIFEWWPGENSWIARTNAASALADYVTNLCNNGWLCHIVAHSHGGNVVIQALPRILTSCRFGNVVTMGTPFMDTTSPMLRAVQRRAKLLLITSWITLACFYVLLLLSLLFGPYIDWDYPDLIWMIGLGAVVITAVIIKHGWLRAKTARTSVSFARLRLFVLSSCKDEAWQVLHHLQTLKDPLAVKSNFIDYFRAASKGKRELEAEIARLQGSASFESLDLSAKLFVLQFHVLLLGVLAYVGFAGLPDASLALENDNILSILILEIAFLLGVELLISLFNERAIWGLWSLYPHFWGLLSVLFSTVGTYLVRRRTWSILQALGMGLDGYSYQMPAVERCPSNLPGASIHYEDIPENALAAAMEKRGAWLLRQFGEASQTFSKLVLTHADVTALLQKIESDQSLVHAAYYTEEDCIRQIAGWIAGERIVADCAQAEGTST
jgi:hypothetical protein